MARSYIDSGELRAAEACVSTGLELEPSDKSRRSLRALREQLTARAAIDAAAHRQVYAAPPGQRPLHVSGWRERWMDAIARVAPGAGKYTVARDQHDHQAPWLAWRGNRHAPTGGFCDELGFVVPPRSERAWKLAHSHSLCLCAQDRPRWHRLLHPDNRSGWGQGSPEDAELRDLVMRHGKHERSPRTMCFPRGLS